MSKRHRNPDFIFAQLPSKTSRKKPERLSTQVSSKTHRLSHGSSVSNEPHHEPTVGEQGGGECPQNVAETSQKTSLGNSTQVSTIHNNSCPVSPIPLSPSPGLGASMPSPRVGKSFYGEGSPASETLATHARGIREEGDSVISTVMGQFWEEDEDIWPP